MPGAEWRELTTLEKELLERLLAPDFPGKEQLACQLARALVAPIDDDGSIRFKVEGAPPASEVNSRVPSEGEFVDADGIYVHLLLHVVDGYLHELEVFKEDGTRVLDWSNANSMTVFAPN